jgi:hypothetical protein
MSEGIISVGYRQNPVDFGWTDVEFVTLPTLSSSIPRILVDAKISNDQFCCSSSRTGQAGVRLALARGRQMTEASPN